jgi:cell division protein FtsB
MLGWTVLTKRSLQLALLRLAFILENGSESLLWTTKSRTNLRKRRKNNKKKKENNAQLLSWIPGFRKEIAAIAPAQVPVGRNEDDKVACNEQAVAPDARAGYFPRVKARRVDRWLDAVVAWSGSWIVFSTILSATMPQTVRQMNRASKHMRCETRSSDLRAMLAAIASSPLMMPRSWHTPLV